MDTSNLEEDRPIEWEEEPQAPWQVILLGNHHVTQSRCIDFDFLEQEQLHIGDWLEKQGWKDFCLLNVPTYPNLVCQFFENMSLGAFHLEGTVKGKHIEISE